MQLLKVLFDTSTLVASMVEDHPSHSNCLPWLQRVQNEEISGYVCTHTIAELYAVLTRFPRTPRISPELAQQLLLENLIKFNTVSLIAEDYQAVIARMVGLNIPGGGIYDGLIAQAAIKAEVNLLLTLNPNNFTRLGEDIARLVHIPTDSF
ncbi:MAG: PIN domain-containing protein [Lyngbya sp.]|nr:PIN domain-containing protein [Lyngbya sp.]